MTTSEVTFAPAVLALRPPRVAVVFPEDDRWRDWVMYALEVFSEYWGGGGFILVPHDPDSGEPSPQFADIIRAHDPDHVVTLDVPLTIFESWYPGTVDVGADHSDEERAERIRNLHDKTSHPMSRYARKVAASWCSPMRRSLSRRDRPGRQHESLWSLGAVNRNARFPPAISPTPPLEAPVLAASSSWRSDLALFAATATGVVREDDGARPEPGPDVMKWILARERDAPTSLLHVPSGSATRPGHHPRTMFTSFPGLMRASRNYLRDGAAVVVGDTGSDFSLALAYDRILGRGFWVTSAVLDDPELLRTFRSSMWLLTTQVERDSEFLTISSASLDEEAVAAAATALQAPEYEYERFGSHRQMVAESETVQIRPPEVERGSMEQLLEEHAGASIVLPMEVMDDGTREAMSGVETPIPSVLMHAPDAGRVPYWYVDVSIGGTRVPHGRDIPASAILALRNTAFPEVTVRASRNGYSFDPASLGFVSSGTVLPGRLGRPRLRALSMRAWVEGMARAEGLGVRLSAAGRQAELVSRRLGSRDQLLTLVRAATLPLLRAFIPDETVPKEREGGRAVIGLDPYLSFDKMSALLGSDEATVEIVDDLSRARLLRRGLVLGCEECGRPSFVDADRVAQQFECPQCAASNTLTSARWREGREPGWFYDLYAPFRDLLRDHGDIPLLAASQLRHESRSYADAPELEFYELDSGTRVAEVDVIASVDDAVVLVEAKVSGQFPQGSRGRQTDKLLRIARVLRADKIVLATSQEEWNTTDVAHLQNQVARAKPFRLLSSTMVELGCLESELQP
ncbi:hypothetical protein [Microbacterium sp. PF5]|uniref:hypothetical protein n=1 Tax=Microbacterium sp. PF5 TaxID=2305435 RepID=UPI00109BB632|nr:hypothetical protein [Microbacterium sp. PF5]